VPISRAPRASTSAGSVDACSNVNGSAGDAEVGDGEEGDAEDGDEGKGDAGDGGGNVSTLRHRHIQPNLDRPLRPSGHQRAPVPGVCVSTYRYATGKC
jgi:hypothetical protein